MSVEIVAGDVRDWAAKYDGQPFHALLSDPPYELGMMGRDWDSSGVAFDPAMWRGLSQHLLPGAFLFAFGASRTYHRLAVALEDSGLRMHPSVFVQGVGDVCLPSLWSWVTGGRMPKATRIDVAVDKATGETQRWGQRDGYNYAQDVARTWEGHRYGGQALRPLVEPVICAMKQYSGKPVDSITSTGAGAIDVDGSRIGGGVDKATGGAAEGSYGGGRFPGIERDRTSGRWPPNAAICHAVGCQRVGDKRVTASSAAVRREDLGSMMYGEDRRPAGTVMTSYADADGLETTPDYRCVEGCPVSALDSGAGELSTHGGNVTADMAAMGYAGGNGSTREIEVSTGGPSRFFLNPDWSLEVAEALITANPAKYCATASRAERDAGLLGLVPCLTCGGMDTGAHAVEGNGHSIDKTASSSDRTRHDVAPRRPYRTEAHDKPCRRNPHVATKPIALVRWLAGLLLPPPEYAPRRILIPFSGGGSEIIGAMLAGWEDIVAVEQSQEYVDIARHRVEFWKRHGDKALDVANQRRKAAPVSTGEGQRPKPRNDQQPDLFDLFNIEGAT